MLPPTGNLTFLFTDIERSSQLWEQHPQAMGRALARHDALLRGIFAEHRGYAFKTMGDAFCVAFEQALDGVVAALELQRRLLEEPWEETGALKVRVALHSGEAEEREGDYFGQTLNRTARILSAGHGGQTLLSRTTAERVREKLPLEISLRDLGERRLKDLRLPERIFQLVVRDLPSEFPPLRSLEVLPNNLPAQVTGFIGRERELAETKRLLNSGRLLTLTGAGGTGKTRLALQLGAEVLDSFPHGVWLVELAMVSDPALVAATVAAELGVREEPERPLLLTLLDALRAQKLLLIIDNCEHLIDVCAGLGVALLRHCPDVRIIATSREPLNIPGETTWPVPSLGMDGFLKEAQIEALSAEEIAAYEAVQLFVDRAAAVRPGFVLTEMNARAVATICWRLDGIPLAIELAAARIKVLTPAQILLRLDDRFRLLSGGSRTALPRQQTLSALIDWSYDLLSEKERTLLCRLSVFVRGRTLAMVEAVCTGEGIDESEVLDLLGSLVDKSLVSVEEEPGFEPRYVLLESVWTYTHDKLLQKGEEAPYRERHLDYFVAFAEEAEEPLHGPEQARWLERVETELGNVRHALDWCEQHPEMVERGLRIGGALERFSEVRSYLKEGRELFATLLAMPTGAVPPEIYAKALLAAGRLAWCQDADDEALRYFERALTLEEELGHTLHVGFLHGYIGFAERNEGHGDSARAHFERALAIAEQTQDPRLLATARSGLGSLAGDAGDLEAARREKEEAMRTFRRLGDTWVQSLIAWSLGNAIFNLRDYPAAREAFAESLRLGRELGNRWAVPHSLEGFGRIALDTGHPVHAARLFGAAALAREGAGLTFSVLERREYELLLKRLREQLPGESFEVEWNTGRAWRPEQAIAAALETPAQTVGSI